jgi:hypothetical protein
VATLNVDIDLHLSLENSLFFPAPVMSLGSATPRRRSRRSETPNSEVSPTQDDEHVDVVYHNPVRVSSLSSHVYYS